MEKTHYITFGLHLSLPQFLTSTTLHEIAAVETSVYEAEPTANIYGNNLPFRKWD